MSNSMGLFCIKWLKFLISIALLCKNYLNFKAIYEIKGVVTIKKMSKSKFLYQSNR